MRIGWVWVWVRACVGGWVSGCVLTCMCVERGVERGGGGVRSVRVRGGDEGGRCGGGDCGGVEEAVAVAAMLAVATAARVAARVAGGGGLDERGRLPPLPPEGVESNNCVSSSLQKAPIRGVCTAERPRLLHPLFLKHLLAHTHTHGACIHAAKGSLQLVHTRAYMLAGVRGMEPSIPATTTI